MSLTIKLAGATFTKFVDSEVPYLDQATGFWLFGGDQASSIKNLAPNGTVLNASVVGTGAPVYGKGLVQMSMTGATASALDSGITLSPAHPFTYIVVGDLIADANYNARTLAGTWHSGINGSDIFQGNASPGATVSGAFSGGNVISAPASTLSPGKIGFAASTSSAAGRAIYTHDGTAMQATTAAALPSPTANTFRVGPFGSRSTNSSVTARYCAAMLFQTVLTQTQLTDIYGYLKWKLAKRGVAVA